MKTPLLALHAALNGEIKRLGYKNTWDVEISTEAVLIDQITLNNSKTVKDTQDYDVTFIFDIITRANSPVKSYKMLENIRENLSLTVKGYMIHDFSIEECNSLKEQDEKGLIIRQLQRCRIKLT